MENGLLSSCGSDSQDKSYGCLYLRPRLTPGLSSLEDVHPVHLESIIISIALNLVVVPSIRHVPALGQGSATIHYIQIVTLMATMLPPVTDLTL